MFKYESSNGGKLKESWPVESQGHYFDRDGIIVDKDLDKDYDR